MNSGELMVVLIVAIVMIAGIVKSRIRAGTTIDAGAQPARDHEADRLRDEVRTLKERLAVLERVITDNHSSGNLDREIEKLRDK